MNMKLEMVMESLPPDAPDGRRCRSHVRRCCHDAARSRAPARPGRPLRLSTAFASPYAADAVELKAIGVPAVVWAPGYIPST